ncbi:hypothetical protein ACX3VT_02085, partial [Aerococcus sanguinicola]|uniref:hypothetical protein n=2 Tax=Aerococcus TaxID=1375 RepID=UPI0008A47683|nr:MULTISPECIES: hypothetical protein [unclassified Aerococcus]KAB0647797.1 hypothetical protein F6I01_01555 [Aerococcus sanguinicola]MDK6232959.1 hypothetical protein [Aerococcus sp. UMB10185]MDK8502084.1 hypothetical protein [Aerococcus sp. UMB1112A]OFN05261.1 hypothetical protein HMPREF2626_04175 [Aerococcus sp. HMSC062A02]OHO43421.1 hypothetical protein HMPREF2705_07980 [Aerococcus sp. HMSC035B07]
MLTPYIPKYKKVAMGLLSYIPRFKDYEEMSNEITKIESGYRSLYLYRDQASDNYHALIAFDEDLDSQSIILRYVAVTPSFRGEGLVSQMITELSELFPQRNFSASIEMSDFFKKWNLEMRQAKGKHSAEEVSDL